MVTFGRTLQERCHLARAAIAFTSSALLLCGNLSYGDSLAAASQLNPTTSAPETAHIPPQQAITSSWIGVVVPQALVDIAPTETGRLAAVNVRPGDAVLAGQELARLDTRNLDREVRVAAAELAAAKADHASAVARADAETRRYERRQGLADIALSREELEGAGSEVTTANAARDATLAHVAQMQARLEVLQQRRSDAGLEAPFAGVVSRRYLDAGAMVSQGMPVVRLVREDAQLVRFAVPPNEPVTLKEGMRVNVVDEHRGLLTTATIVQIAPEIDVPAQMVFVDAVPLGAAGQGAGLQPFRVGASVWVEPVQGQTQ